MSSPLTSYSLYFTGESADVIIKAINRQDFELLRSLKNSHESGLLLDMISTDEFQYNQYRLYRYSSYRFEPITDIMSMNSKTAQYLAGITH